MTNGPGRQPRTVTSGTVGDTKTRNARTVKYFVGQNLMKLWPSAVLRNQFLD